MSCNLSVCCCQLAADAYVFVFVFVSFVHLSFAETVVDLSNETVKIWKPPRVGAAAANFEVGNWISKRRKEDFLCERPNVKKRT